GPALSPFNAWVLLKGLETLQLRMVAQSAAALELARWLERHRAVARVHYPGLASHPQHELAKRQQRAAGSVLSFEVKGGRAAAWPCCCRARRGMQRRCGRPPESPWRRFSSSALAFGPACGSAARSPI